LLQVQYVLSDKTGTLTQNIMGFVWASIGGKMYGQTQHASQAAALQQQRRLAANTASNGSSHQGNKGLLAAGASAAAGAPAGGATGGSKGSAAATARSPSPASGGGVIITSADEGPPPNTPHTIALDSELRYAAAAAAGAGMTAAGGFGSSGSNGVAAAAAVHDFLVALAVCNTVVPTATDQGHLLYQVGCWAACRGGFAGRDDPRYGWLSWGWLRPARSCLEDRCQEQSHA
jgi:magnesium-transporting ATPase (P-type)